MVAPSTVAGSARITSSHPPSASAGQQRLDRPGPPAPRRPAPRACRPARGRGRGARAPAPVPRARRRPPPRRSAPRSRLRSRQMRAGVARVQVAADAAGLHRCGRLAQRFGQRQHLLLGLHQHRSTARRALRRPRPGRRDSRPIRCSIGSAASAIGRARRDACVRTAA